MAKLRIIAPKTKLTDQEELDKEMIENDDFYLVEEEDEDDMWEGGLFI